MNDQPHTDARRWRADTVYLLFEGTWGFLFTLMGTIYSVYAVIAAELGAFQLLMLGTILEGTVLIFEVPTGVLADVVSRRASVIIGTFVNGVAFITVGAVPTFVGLAAGSFTGEQRHRGRRTGWAELISKKTLVPPTHALLKRWRAGAIASFFEELRSYPSGQPRAQSTHFDE